MPVQQQLGSLYIYCTISSGQIEPSSYREQHRKMVIFSSWMSQTSVCGEQEIPEVGQFTTWQLDNILVMITSQHSLIDMELYRVNQFTGLLLNSSSTHLLKPLTWKRVGQHIIVKFADVIQSHTRQVNEILWLQCWSCVPSLYAVLNWNFLVEVWSLLIILLFI